MRPVNVDKYDDWLKQLKANTKEMASIEDIKQHPIEVVARYLVVVKQKLGEKSLDYAAMEPFKTTHDIYSLYAKLMEYYSAQCEFLWPEFVDNATFDPFPLYFLHTVFKKDSRSTEIARFEFFLSDKYQSIIENGFPLHEYVDVKLLCRTHNKLIVDIPLPCTYSVSIPEITGPTRLEINDKLCNLSKDYLHCLSMFSTEFGTKSMEIIAIATVISRCAFDSFKTLSIIRQIENTGHILPHGNRFVCQIFLFSSFLWWVCDNPLCYRTLLTIDDLYMSVFRDDELALLNYYHLRVVYALRFSPDERDKSNMVEAMITHVAHISSYAKKYFSSSALLYFGSYLADGKMLDKIWKEARSDRNSNNIK